MDDFWNQDEGHLMKAFGLDSDPALASSSGGRAPDWGGFAQALRQAGNSLASDASGSEANGNQAQEQLAQFGQRVGFTKLPGTPNPVGAAAIDPLNVTMPMSRPGEIAIRALANLYR